MRRKPQPSRTSIGYIKGSLKWLIDSCDLVTELLLDYTRDETRKLVIKAFDRTDGISEIQASEYQIVGKTGFGFPRILWSYGEKIFVDLSETNSPNQTRIKVRGEKNVSVNIGANADKFKRRFLNELKSLRKGNVSETVSSNSVEQEKHKNKPRKNDQYHTDESDLVTEDDSSGNTTKTIGLALIVIGVFGLLIGAVMPSGGTQTAETCVDDPTGYGEDCYSSTVETTNPAKGMAILSGYLSIFVGIITFIWAIVYGSIRS